MSVNSAIRWTARASSEGSPRPRRQGRPAGQGPLAAHLAYLIAVVEAEPDVAMPELAARLQAATGSMKPILPEVAALLANKGYINQREVQRRRPEAVERRYKLDDPEVILP